MKSTKVYTSSQQSYRTVHRSMLDAQDTTFKVKSAHDAMLSMLRVPNNFQAPSYEIIIGAVANSKTILYVKSSTENNNVFEINTPGILSAVELRAFWISWKNGTIHFGTGENVGQNALLNYTDPLPIYRKNVHSIAVASGLGAVGEWEFGEAFETGM